MTSKQPSQLTPANRKPAQWFVVPAAGIGQRMQADKPKQYLPLGDTTILEQTLTALLAVPQIAGIVVAIHPDDQYWEHLPVASHEKIHTVKGGAERSDSVLAALDYLQDYLSPQDWVLVHDAARPCVQVESIQSLLEDLVDNPVGGILGVPSSDTLKRVDGEQSIQQTVDRRTIWQAQTPQMFRYGVLYEALSQAQQSGSAITDEASAVEIVGHSVKIIQGRVDNIKVTHPDDLWIAEAVLARNKG